MKAGDSADDQIIFEQVQRVTIASDRIQIVLKNAKRAGRPIEIGWSPKPKSSAQVRHTGSGAEADPKLIRAIARARAWLDQLSNGKYDSIEALAAAANYNPKVIRQGLRLAFLAPEMTEAAIAERPGFKLAQIPKTLPLSWRDQRRAIG